MSQTQVQSGFIGDNSVTTTQIADGNITTAKIAANAITTAKIAANAITTAKLDSTVSNSLVPIGGIVMWSGTIAQAQALVGWAICDGNNGTPNLTNRFIVASHNGFGSGTVPTAGPGFNASNGALTSDYTPGSVGGETAHQLTIAELASHNHTVALYRGEGSSFAGGTVNNGQLNSAGGVSSTGGNQFHENRPLYYGLAFIMRVS